MSFTYPLRAEAGPYSPIYAKGSAKFHPYGRFPIVFVVGRMFPPAFSKNLKKKKRSRSIAQSDLYFSISSWQLE